MAAPSCSCPWAESRPGPWGLQEAGKQVGVCRLQSFKERKYMFQAYILCVESPYVCVYLFTCMHIHVCVHVCRRSEDNFGFNYCVGDSQWPNSVSRLGCLAREPQGSACPCLSVLRALSIRLNQPIGAYVAAYACNPGNQEAERG